MIVADAQHQWLTDAIEGGRDVRTTEQIAASLRAGSQANHAVTNSAPLALPDAPLSLPPYALGVWLGCGALCSSDREITAFLEAELPEDLDVAAELDALGVLGRPHIPGRYLWASVRQRKELLAGLLDSSASVAAHGDLRLRAASRRLARDVRGLLNGLGHQLPEAQGNGHELTFAIDDDVFRVESKQLRHKQARTASTSPRRARSIVDVRTIESVPVRCIQVDAEDHLFLAGRSFIPTHNSTLGLDIARSASVKHHLPAAIFSLEMSKHEITMRLLSAEAKVPLHHMRAGTLSDEDWSKLARRMGEIADAPLYIDDSPNMTMMEIRAKARRLKQRNDLKLVVIDYLQLMTSGKRVESRQQEVSEFSRALKLLAKELEVPVIAMSQLNRGSEQRQDKKPMLSDLRESGCLTADTRILRADTGAETTMGELFEAGATDVPVWSLDDNLRYVRRHLTHVFSTGRKQVFELTTASGKTVRATANHPFLTFDGFRPLGELAPGDRIAVPRHVPAPDRMTVWEDERVTLLAHLIGDGSFVKRQPLRYASVDEANLRAVTTAALNLGVVAVRDDHAAARCTTLRLRAPFPLTHGKRNPIAAWLDDLGLFGLRSHEKFVPEPVFCLPKKQIALFLRHLWATDGVGDGEQERPGRAGLLRLHEPRARRRHLPTAAAVRHLLPHPSDEEARLSRRLVPRHQRLRRSAAFPRGDRRATGHAVRRLSGCWGSSGVCQATRTSTRSRRRSGSASVTSSPNMA